jgi:drug/metabolite transporter (DMT)-like permease
MLRAASLATAIGFSDHTRGVLLMIGATLCWASAGVLVRSMRLTGAWEITFWRSLFMTLFVLGVLAAQYRGATVERIRAVGRPGVVVGALWALMYVCFILALGRTTVANVLVLSGISPLAAAVLGRLFLREHVHTRSWLAMVAACGGIGLMFVESLGNGALIGNLIALAIPLAFACNVVLLRRTHAEVDMLPTLVLSGVFSMLIALPLAVPFHAEAWDLALLVPMGVVQLGLGCLLMLAAAPRLRAAEIGLLAVLEIVFGTLSTWLVAGESPGALAAVGGLLVIGALVANEVIGLRRRAASPAEEMAAATQVGH